MFASAKRFRSSVYHSVKKSLLMAKQKGQFAIANHDKATQHKEPMKTPIKRM